MHLHGARASRRRRDPRQRRRIGQAERGAALRAQGPYPCTATSEGREIERVFDLMRARPATGDEARDWDRLMNQTARPHLLQSTGWAEVKSATGWRAERYVFEESDSFVGC